MVKASASISSIPSELNLQNVARLGGASHKATKVVTPAHESVPPAGSIFPMLFEFKFHEVPYAIHCQNS
jgi:hypothetical protein